MIAVVTSELTKARGIARDALRFAALSGCCWLLDLGLLLCLTAAMAWPAFAANVVSSLVAAAAVYLNAHSRIHSGQANGGHLRLGLYLCYTLAVILAASRALNYIETGLSGFAWPGVWVTLLAKIAITPPQLLCNFLVSRFVARVAIRRTKFR